MSDQPSNQEPLPRSVLQQPAYIAWMLLLVGFVFVAQWLVPVGLYCVVYGVPSLGDWMKLTVPDYKQVALWKGRVWHVVRTMGPNVSEVGLVAFDLETGELHDPKMNLPIRMGAFHGFVADGDRLWCVGTGSVQRIEGEAITEIVTSPTVTSVIAPFLYDGKLATLDAGTAKSPVNTVELLMLDDKTWRSQGSVVLPLGYVLGTGADGSQQIIRDAGQLATQKALSDTRVWFQDDVHHIFHFDGTHLAYRRGLMLKAVSALAPENVEPSEDDLREIEGWHFDRAPFAQGDEWRATLVDGEPMVISVSAPKGRNPFGTSTTLKVHRLEKNTWTEIATQRLPLVIALLAASDGTETYAGVETISQAGPMFVIGSEGLRRMGWKLKPPKSSFEEPLERWASLYHWTYWPGLMLLAHGVAALMALYRDPRYEFGKSRVELASIARRGWARAIDLLLMSGPMWLVMWSMGLTTPEGQAQRIDELFEADSLQPLVAFLWVILGALLYMLFVTILLSWLQGRWGVTPGKWVCGIRIVRTTLRPSGFFRAFARELLLAVDTIMCMTWVPATLFIAFTACRQRIGDLVVDTIVIRRPRESVEWGSSSRYLEE